MNVRLAPLTLSDADAVARVLRTSYDWALPHLAGRHTPAQDVWFVRERLLPSAEATGAWLGSQLVGYSVCKPGWIEHLYVRPGSVASGVGSALLEVAKRGAVQLDLWTFQCNTRARRFYESRGFAAVETTDGAGNEEREPDVRYRWCACRVVT